MFLLTLPYYFSRRKGSLKLLTPMLLIEIRVNFLVFYILFSFDLQVKLVPPESRIAGFIYCGKQWRTGNE